MAISDLQSHLAVSSEAAFITSDNPAFKYKRISESTSYQAFQRQSFSSTGRSAFGTHGRQTNATKRQRKTQHVSGVSGHVLCLTGSRGGVDRHRVDRSLKPYRQDQQVFEESLPGEEAAKECQ